jgi:putative heme-binding domain-containing protein
MVSLKRVVPIASAWSLLTVLQPASLGQNSLSVSTPEADNSVKAELASFAMDKELQVNLFADESMGIANPVCMRWDARGRLWVLCTWAYPQLKPGAKPNDKLLILEDTNGDAKADEISTYIDGLNMPTGFALGHGGAYIGNGRELLHVRDTTGDGKADKRIVLFSGFGTGDTHQTINSFAWSPGGELFFSQGLHCFSRVQTPWGIRKLDEHGSWRLRPLRRQLHAHRRTSGGGNPWGFAFGDWGEPFIKSNGPGVSELLPGMVASEQIVGDYWGGAVQIGATKIKSMIIEIIDTPVLPKDFQGDFLIAGYFARNIARLRPTVNGAGHKLQTLAPILTSTHNAFRPVDLNTGPDGALYVADWFNPIIGHYQASLRHPDRDKKHGRIWRITTKLQPLLKPPALPEMNAAQLCNQLSAPLRRTRKLAKLRLMDLPKAKAIAATQQWVDALKPTDPALEAKLFEAIGVFESHEVMNRPLLERLLASKDYRARAYATRVVGRWHDRLKNPLALLRSSATDEHSRVRLEAIVAVSDVHEAESIAIAAQAADGSADRFITFAFKNAVHALSSKWKPALLAGKLDFAKPAHLLSVVRQDGGNEVASVVRQKLADPALSTARKLVLAELLAQIGNSADAAMALELASIHPTVLHALVNAARERNLQAPTNAAELLNVPLKSTTTRVGAVQLIGAWRLNAHAETIRTLATGETEPLAVRVAAAVALGQLNIPEALETLASLVTVNGTATLRVAALGSLAKHDVARAAQLTARLSGQVNPDELGPVLAALLQRNAGADAMAGALGQAEVSADTAKLILRWLNAAGRVEPKLNLVLNKLIGVQSIVPVYSTDFVGALAKEALAKGDAVNGKKVFQLPLASCTACHAVDGVRGAVTSVKGPNLSAVAAGLPMDLLVESVLWPARQIKEGYAATTVITKDGRVLSGFAHSEDKTVLRVRDLATGKIATVQTANIKQRTRNGTVMPPGLTGSLTRAELRDLIKYLSTLKTTGEFK